MQSRRELYWALPLALILGAQIWLRAGNLGENSLFVDEYFHVHAGQALLESGEPRLPGGGLYRRALPYTYVVAGFFHVFGVSEVSARLPSLIASSLLVLLVFAVGRLWFGNAAGLVAAAIVASAPPLALTARLCRMYAPFELFYLAALLAYERGWERDRIADGSLVWKLACPLLLYGSYRLHSLSANFAAAIAVYWVVMLVVARDRRYALYLAGATGAAVLAAAIGVVDVADLWRASTVKATWATAGKDAGFYTSVWAESYPGLWLIVAAAIPFACLRLGRRGILLTCQFVVPMLLLSLVFSRKEHRYATFLLPLLALLVAPFLVWAAGQVAAWTRRLAQRSESQVTLGLAVVLAVEFAAVTLAWFTPSVLTSYALRSEPYMPNYRAAYARVAGLAEPGDLLLASVPSSAEYYLPRNGVALVAGEAETRSPRPWLRWHPNTGWQQTLADLERSVAGHPRGWLITERGWFYNGTIVALPVRRFIESRMRAEPVDDAATVMVFRWG